MQLIQGNGNILHLPELEKQISDLQELNDKTKILESELNKKTAMIRTLTFRQLEGLKTMLPIGEIPISNNERNMVAGRNCNFNSNFKP